MELESLHRLESHGIEMIIAIDSTARGPALGGCRWCLYPDASAARSDAIALARAMTRKASLARLPLGGGKAVVFGDPKSRTREQLLAFGELVQSLGGRYITAADMGTGAQEMLVISETTPHVVGLPVARGGCGEPSPHTALGVFSALERALRHSNLTIRGARVAVQGAGSVGAALIHQLLEAGAEVMAADSDPAAVAVLPREVERVTPDEILTRPCEVLAPCGPASAIDLAVTERLACRIVCGAANNPLAGAEVSQRLAERGILYVPDFLANAGGLIHLSVALEGGDDAATRARLRVIPANLDRVLSLAESEGIDPGAAAERLALERLAE